MKEIKSGWGGGEAHAILLEKSGDRQTLFTAFLNALGIKHDTVVLGPSPTTYQEIEWDIPRKSYFSSTMMRVLPKGHSPIFVTMHTRYLPLGKIPERLQGSPVYIPDRGLENMPLMPQESADEVADKEFFAVNLKTLTCSARLEYPAAYSYGRKEYYKDLPVRERKQEIERLANSFFPGAIVEQYELPGLETVGRMFEVRFDCKAPNFLTAKEDGSIVAKTAVKPLNLQERYADKAARKFDMILFSRQLSRTQAVIDTGGMYEIRELPKDLYIRNDFGNYALSFKREGSLIKVSRSLTLVPQRIKVDRYHDFLDFCRTIDEAEMGRIILEKAQAEKEAPGGETDRKNEKE